MSDSVWICLRCGGNIEPNSLKRKQSTHYCKCPDNKDSIIADLNAKLSHILNVIAPSESIEAYQKAWEELDDERKARLSAMEAERDAALIQLADSKKEVSILLEKNPDIRLDAYRELGQKCCAFDKENAELRAENKTLKTLKASLERSLNEALNEGDGEKS